MWWELFRFRPVAFVSEGLFALPPPRSAKNKLEKQKKRKHLWKGGNNVEDDLWTTTNKIPFPAATPNPFAKDLSLQSLCGVLWTKRETSPHSLMKASCIRVVTNYLDQCINFSQLHAWNSAGLEKSTTDGTIAEQAHPFTNFWIPKHPKIQLHDLRTLLTLDTWWDKQRVVMIEAHPNTSLKMSAVEWQLMQSML